MLRPYYRWQYELELRLSLQGKEIGVIYEQLDPAHGLRSNVTPGRPHWRLGRGEIVS